ncbi:MAG: HAMP domain-containing sensor histidine kinase [Actinomycetota bacterium]
MRPLEKLPSIRAKLGSVIVLAVAMTLLISYAVIGYALRDSPRDTEAIDTLQLANRAATGQMPDVPAGTAIVRRSVTDTVTIEGTGFSVLPPEFNDGVPHWGIVGHITYASVPTADGGWVTAMQPSPSRGSLGRMSATLGFLQSMWWQFLLAGVTAGLISLLIARWLARGMTQPLRDMAAAARAMETGDYTVRVLTTSRDEVGQLAAAFNRMSAELAVLEKSRRDLVANVSHELKTPITAIRAHLENLADGVEQPDPKTLQVMLSQTERLGRLVDQLLDLSRLESGEVPLYLESTTLEPIVTRVLSEIAVGRSVTDVTLRDEVPADVAAIADAERIHQVLYNLVDNAVRFTPPGGSVSVSASRHDDRVSVAVRDSGVGIAPEHLPRLFERFYRADASRSREGGGTGIGLAIARSIVEAHGGRITATSQPGNGSTFTFDLPAAEAAVSTTDRRAST